MKTNFLRGMVPVLLAAWCFLPLQVGAQSKIRDLTDADIYLKGVFGPDCFIDEYGNLSLDAKAYGGTPVLFRLTDVLVQKEEKAEGPQCPPPCKPSVTIRFECRKSPCIAAMGSGSALNWPPGGRSHQLIFEDVRKGRKVYLALLEMQRFLRQSNMQVPAK